MTLIKKQKEALLKIIHKHPIIKEQGKQLDITQLVSLINQTQI